MAKLSAARRGHFEDTVEANLPMSTRRLCLRVDIGAIPNSQPSLGNDFFSLVPQPPATKKGANTVHFVVISWLLKIGPCGKRCPSGPFMGPLATSASGTQALAAGCPCVRQLCFFPQLLMIPGWLLMISDQLLMIYCWLSMISGWLLMIFGWLIMISGWL